MYFLSTKAREDSFRRNVGIGCVAIDTDNLDIAREFGTCSTHVHNPQ
jgi:hypothetical protein